jgi:hypothetical protein
VLYTSQLSTAIEPNDSPNKLSRVSQGEPASNKSSRVVKELALNDSGKYKETAFSRTFNVD